MLTSIYYPSFPKTCKEIIAKNNTSAGIRTRISQTILSIFSGMGDNRCLLASNC